MEILYENPARRPALSIVLLDWSVRESFHMLDYLQKQDVPRDRYEIIWIEYYGRRAGEIKELLDKAEKEGAPPPVDVWLVVDMPLDLYYHKHLMYNLGIILSKGEIVCFCDSDAVVKPTFVAGIIGSFDADRNIVLHMEELRSINRDYYPFNYPPVSDIERTSENFVGGKPRGLNDRIDPIHSLNYGACMCARRADLIAIGGADEHMDYLGHVCGPYEMTFRLMNAGKREVWHQSEWLLHTWHPGQAGGGNYIGPNDGIHVSTTAREARKSGRVMPLKENPAIRKLREGGTVDDLGKALDKDELNKWKIGLSNDWRTKLKKLWLSKNPLYGPSGGKPPRIGFYTAFRLYWILVGMIVKQTYIKVKVQLAARSTIATPEIIPGQDEEKSSPRPLKIFKSILVRFQNLWGFIARMWAHDRFMAGECREALAKLSADGVSEVAVFGTGDVAEMLQVLQGELPIRISGFYDDVSQKGLMGYKVKPLEDIKGYGGKVIVASFVNLENRMDALKRAGVKEEDIFIFK